MNHFAQTAAQSIEVEVNVSATQHATPETKTWCGRVHRTLDAIETLALILLYGGQFAAWWRTSIHFVPRVGSGVLLLSEFLALILFVTRRRATVRSTSLADWLVAWLAVAAPLLLRPGKDSALDTIAPVAVIALLAGFVIQVHAKCALGRNLGIVPALRDVCASGPYRYVRHPMYVGYALSQAGFVALHPTFANLVVVVMACLLQWVRLQREERVLAINSTYAAYARRVRYRLVPGLY